MLSFAKRFVTAVARQLTTSSQHVELNSGEGMSSIEPVENDLAAVPGQWPNSRPSTPVQEDIAGREPTSTTPAKEDFYTPPTSPLLSNDIEDDNTPDTEEIGDEVDSEETAPVVDTALVDLFGSLSTKFIAEAFDESTASKVQEQRALRAKAEQEAAAQAKKAAELEQETANEEHRVAGAEAEQNATAQEDQAADVEQQHEELEDHMARKMKEIGKELHLRFMLDMILQSQGPPEDPVARRREDEALWAELHILFRENPERAAWIKRCLQAYVPEFGSRWMKIFSDWVQRKETREQLEKEQLERRRQAEARRDAPSVPAQTREQLEMKQLEKRRQAEARRDALLVKQALKANMRTDGKQVDQDPLPPMPAIFSSTVLPNHLPTTSAENLLTATETTATEPAATEPTATEPTATETVATEPAETEPSALELTVPEPSETEIAAPEPAAKKEEELEYASPAVEVPENAPLPLEDAAAASPVANTFKAKSPSPPGRKQPLKHKKSDEKKLKQAKVLGAANVSKKRQHKKSPKQLSPPAFALLEELNTAAVVEATVDEKTTSSPPPPEGADLLAGNEAFLRRVNSIQRRLCRETEDSTKSKEPQLKEAAEFLKYQSFRLVGWRETEVFFDADTAIDEDGYTRRVHQTSADVDFFVVPAIKILVNTTQSSSLQQVPLDDAAAEVILSQAIGQISLDTNHDSAHAGAPQAASIIEQMAQLAAGAQIVPGRGLVDSGAADGDDEFSDLSSDHGLLDEYQVEQMLAPLRPGRDLTPPADREVNRGQQPRMTSRWAFEKREDGGAEENQPNEDAMEYDPTMPSLALQPPVFGPGFSSCSTNNHWDPNPAAPALFPPVQGYQQTLQPMFHPLTFNNGNITTPSVAEEADHPTIQVASNSRYMEVDSGVNVPPIQPPTNSMEVDEEPGLEALLGRLRTSLRLTDELSGDMDGVEQESTQLEADTPMGVGEHHLYIPPATEDVPLPTLEDVPLPALEVTDTSALGQDPFSLPLNNVPLRLPNRADVVAFLPAAGIHRDELWRHYGEELRASPKFNAHLSTLGSFDGHGWYHLHHMRWQMGAFPTLDEFRDAVPRSGISASALNERFPIVPSRHEEYLITLFFCWGKMDQNEWYLLNEDAYGNNFADFGYLPVQGSRSGPDNGSQQVLQSNTHAAPEQPGYYPAVQPVPEQSGYVPAVQLEPEQSDYYPAVQPVPVVDESDRYDQAASELTAETAADMITDPPKPAPSSFFPSKKEVLMAIPVQGKTVTELWYAFKTTRVPKARLGEFKAIVMEVTVPKPKSVLRFARQDLIALMLEWRENKYNFPTGQLPPPQEPYQRCNMCWNPACPRQDKHYCLKDNDFANPAPLAGIQTVTPGNFEQAWKPAGYDPASPAEAMPEASMLPGLGNYNFGSVPDNNTNSNNFDQPKTDRGKKVDLTKVNCPEQFGTSFVGGQSNGGPQPSTSTMPGSSSHQFTFVVPSSIPPSWNPQTIPTIGMVDGDSSDDEDEEPTRPFPTVEELKDFVDLEGVKDVAALFERFQHRINFGQEQRFQDLVDEHTWYDDKRRMVYLKAPRLPSVAEISRHLPIGRGALMDKYEKHLPKCNVAHQEKFLEVVRRIATWDSDTLMYHAKVQEKPTTYPTADEIFHEIPVPHGISFGALKAKFEGRLDSQPNSRFNELVRNVSTMNHSRILKRKQHYFTTSAPPAAVTDSSPAPASAPPPPSNSRARAPSPEGPPFPTQDEVLALELDGPPFPTQDEVFYAIPADAGIKFKTLMDKFKARIAGADFKFLKVTQSVSTKSGFLYRRKPDYCPASIPSWCINPECGARDFCDCPEPGDGEE